MDLSASSSRQILQPVRLSTIVASFALALFLNFLPWRDLRLVPDFVALVLAVTLTCGGASVKVKTAARLPGRNSSPASVAPGALPACCSVSTSGIISPATCSASA